jgi:hypothetical protein
MKASPTLLFAFLVSLPACATTSSAKCASSEQCIQRCENAGTPREANYPYNGQGTSLSACERECGTCRKTPTPKATAAPTPTPTFSGY